MAVQAATSGRGQFSVARGRNIFPEDEPGGAGRGRGQESYSVVFLFVLPNDFCQPFILKPYYTIFFNNILFTFSVVCFYVLLLYYQLADTPQTSRLNIEKWPN